MFKAANKTEKVSDYIISQVRDAILSRRLKPGDRLASEKELLSQFTVSKATTREALRVLESMGLIEIKKGVGGGVFIAEVDMKTTINSIINFLYFKSISIKDITMIRYMLEPSIAEFAASRIKPEDIDKLENMIEENLIQKPTDTSLGIGFHRYLARLSENPILILIMDFIDNLLRDIKLRLNLGTEFFINVQQAHRRIVDCLIRKDSVGARQEIAKDILGVGNYMAALAGVPAFDPAILEVGIRRDQSISEDSNPKQSNIEPILMKELQKRIGTEMAEKLLEQVALFQQVGSGELYLFSFKDAPDQTKSRKEFK